MTARRCISGRIKGAKHLLQQWLSARLLEVPGKTIYLGAFEGQQSHQRAGLFTPSKRSMHFLLRLASLSEIALLCLKAGACRAQPCWLLPPQAVVPVRDHLHSVLECLRRCERGPTRSVTRLKLQRATGGLLPRAAGPIIAMVFNTSLHKASSEMAAKSKWPVWYNCT